MRADFLLVTALAEERDAVLAELPGHVAVSQTTNNPFVYFTADVVGHGHDRPYQITVLCLPGMGRVAAAVATNEAIMRWHPEYVMMLGIAGGIGKQNVALGDVLVSTQILDYELAKIELGGASVRPSYPPISQRLLHGSQNFLDRGWAKSLKSRPSPGEPQVLFGPVASGDKVINDPAALARLIALHPKLLGVEMEAGGAGAASHHNETNFFMVRGVSDLADGQKDRSDVVRWRQYACEVAAAYAMGLVRSGLLPSPGPRELTNSYEDVANAIAAATKSIAIVDKLAGPVESLLTDTPDRGGHHRVFYEGAGIELVARQHGQVVQTITGQDLQRLPAEQLRHLRVREKALENYYAIWEQVYPQLPLMADPMSQARVKLQLKQTISDMKSELEAILNFISDSGLYLDDHYRNFRDVIREHA